MNKPITFGSLFAGIGGWDLGLERAGWECKWQVEIDDYCNRVLEKHWPDVPRYRDVYGVSASSLETVDAICGGFPCQPFSLAGRRQGTSDERWLWPEFARLVGEMEPKVVLVENVPGIYSKGGVEVAADLTTLGYDYEWDSISAKTLGAPHKRERFLLVAYSNSQGLQGFGGERKLGKPKRKSTISRRSQLTANREFGAYWEVEPRVGRVANGIPNSMDRLKALGNSMLPQIAELLGKEINEVF